MRLALDALRVGRLAFGAQLLAPLMGRSLPATGLMGDLQLAAGNPAKAEEAYVLALKLELRQPEILVKLGELYYRTGRYADAKALVHEALAQRDNHPRAYFLLSQIHGAQGEHELCLTALDLAMAAEPKNPELGSGWVVRHAYMAGYGDAELLAAGREWERRYASGVQPLPPVPREPLPGRRLRVGYVSPDFRRHATAYFFLPLLTHHDRAAFEVFCYHTSPFNDDLTAAIRQRAEHWRPAMGKSDEALAAQIRQDKIDVVVDLAGHFTNPHLRMHCLRPAPVHVHHLGFCGTTGLSAFAARLTDAIIEPPNAGCEALSAEPLVRLGRGLHAHDPFDPLPPVQPSPALRNGYVTFGSCNNHAKLAGDVFPTWLRILGRAPTARLLIKNPELSDADLRQRVKDWFVQRGIAAERVMIAPPVKTRLEHLAIYHQIDIHLDSFPYNGVTTTCEALWMGVPVLTVRGACHRGRIGESLLHSAGETGAVAENPDDYVERAAAWSLAPERLADDRIKRRIRLEKSALADGPGYASAVENALMQLVK